MTDQHHDVKKLRDLVDATADRLVGGGISLAEAEELVQQTRLQAEELIPQEMEKYDLIYEARFRRLIEQFVEQPHVSG
jgi:pyrroline-5-carboxylate reductase